MVLYEYLRQEKNILKIFEEEVQKKIKPVCFGHGTRLFILLLSCKSLAFDYKEYRKIIFPELKFSVNNSNDIKTLVLNERDLYLFHCSKS